MTMTSGPPAQRRAPDTAWIDRVYRAEYPRLVGAITLRAHDPELAADVAQDAFVRLVVQAGTGSIPDNVEAWLYAVARNLLVSRIRRDRVAMRHRPEIAIDRSRSTLDLEARSILRETVGTIERPMLRLTPSSRLAIYLAAEGRSPHEMAGPLGRSAGASRTLLCRARARLRSLAALDDGEWRSMVRTRRVRALASPRDSRASPARVRSPRTAP
jgi:RNA polymerase sigma factor (sigma-70 family)